MAVSTICHVRTPTSRSCRRLDRLHLGTPLSRARRMLPACWSLQHEIQQASREDDGNRGALPPTAVGRTGNPVHKIYPYLLRGMAITRPNQVWAMDITYIPMALRLRLSGGCARLVQPSRAVVALHRSRWRRHSASRPLRTLSHATAETGHLQHGPGRPVSTGTTFTGVLIKNARPSP